MAEHIARDAGGLAESGAAWELQYQPLELCAIGEAWRRNLAFRDPEAIAEVKGDTEGRRLADAFTAQAGIKAKYQSLKPAVIGHDDDDDD